MATKIPPTPVVPGKVLPIDREKMHPHGNALDRQFASQGDSEAEYGSGKYRDTEKDLQVLAWKNQQPDNDGAECGYTVIPIRTAFPATSYCDVKGSGNARWDTYPNSPIFDLDNDIPGVTKEEID